MMSEDDDFEDSDDDRRRAQIIRRARVEGIEVAYETALAVCRDAKAPAQAKASAQRTLMQIGGLLDRADRQDGREKPASELSPSELTAAVAEITRRQRAKKQPPAKEETPRPSGSVFD